MKGLHRIVLNTVTNAEKMDPRLGQEVSRPLTLFFRDRLNSDTQAPHSTVPSLLTRALPEALHLLTAQQWPLEGQSSRRQFLIRLQHIGSPEIGEITLELSDIFTLGRVIKATEMSLTANQLADADEKNNLAWPPKYTCCGRTSGYLNAGKGTQVKIRPAEIKTLILDLA